MATIRLVTIFIALLGLHTATSAVTTNLLPGLRFNEIPLRLSGSLVFLYCPAGFLSPTAGIYNYDLEKRSLRMVTNCPAGTFYTADDGMTFCVLYGANVGYGIFGTNAFMYSERWKKSGVYSFHRRPSRVSFSLDYVFLHFDRRVFGYNMLTSELQPASEEKVKANDSVTLGRLAVPAVDHGFDGFKDVDGRWVYFDGKDGPLQGKKLLSSSLNEFDTHHDDPKGKNVKVLKRFSGTFRGSYSLTQMSPCRRYALVRASFPIGDAWGYKYYMVNVQSGNTHVLLEDTVASIKKSRISEIHWVDQPPAK